VTARVNATSAMGVATKKWREMTHSDDGADRIRATETMEHPAAVPDQLGWKRHRRRCNARTTWPKWTPSKNTWTRVRRYMLAGTHANYRPRRR
jgi:hypothetical protein